MSGRGPWEEKNAVEFPILNAVRVVAAQVGFDQVAGDRLYFCRAAAKAAHQQAHRGLQAVKGNGGRVGHGAVDEWCGCGYGRGAAVSGRQVKRHSGARGGQPNARWRHRVAPATGTLNAFTLPLGYASKPP